MQVGSEGQWSWNQFKLSLILSISIFYNFNLIKYHIKMRYMEKENIICEGIKDYKGTFATSVVI